MRNEERGGGGGNWVLTFFKILITNKRTKDNEKDNN